MAHKIWEQEGWPEGKDLEHYFRAKQIQEEKENTRFIELPPSPPIPELSPHAVNKTQNPNKHKKSPRRKKNKKDRL